jgi:microcystin-dependent protein
MDEYLGIIKIFAGNYAPIGWMMCQGQVLNVAEYPQLFANLGNAFGGDGKVTFALPDYRGRAPFGMTMAGSFPQIANGAEGGAVAVQINSGNMPSHNHMVVGTVQLPVNDSPADTTSPVGAFLAQPAQNMYLGAEGVDYGGNVYYDFSSDDTGSTNPAPISIMCPYLAVNYIINVSSTLNPMDDEAED